MTDWQFRKKYMELQRPGGYAGRQLWLKFEVVDAEKVGATDESHHTAEIRVRVRIASTTIWGVESLRLLEHNDEAMSKQLFEFAKQHLILNGRPAEEEQHVDWPAGQRSYMTERIKSDEPFVVPGGKIGFGGGGSKVR